MTNCSLWGKLKVTAIEDKEIFINLPSSIRSRTTGEFKLYLKIG
jgi:hypothetical protein